MNEIELYKLDTSHGINDTNQEENEASSFLSLRKKDVTIEMGRKYKYKRR